MSEAEVHCEAAEDAAEFAPLKLLEELEAESSSSAPVPKRERLSLDQITTLEALFQPRGLAESHVSELRRALENFGDLDPLTVVQVGPRAVLIDGHHRREAYRRAKRTNDIPVRYFEGSVREAVLEAGRANSKAKLPMTMQERQDYAWRLVCLQRHTKSDVARASGASTSTVAAMRRARKELGGEAFKYTSWWQARQQVSGVPRELDEEGREQWMKELAQDFANRLTKTFSNKLSQQPEIAAMALATYFGRRLPAVIRELEQHVGADDLDEDNDDF